jgi:hypothetical protein
MTINLLNHFVKHFNINNIVENSFNNEVKFFNPIK